MIDPGAGATAHTSAPDPARIIADPRFQTLVTRRSSFAWTLSAVMLAIFLGYLFEKQNVAFMLGLAFAVAASCNFPVLLMSIMWRGTTTLGAVVGGFAGLVCSLAMVVLSKAVWVTTLGHPAALFPYDNPALFSMPLAFLIIWLVSLADKSRRVQGQRAAFDAQFVRAETGIGATGAHTH